MEPAAGWLLWVLPPSLGAAIGYITNAIAIRMLFRPLEAKYFFKIRIPFTPGIIPRQRGNLADSIARMVSRELLTHDALQRQIHSEKFQQGLLKNIEGFTETILSARIGSPSNLLSPGGERDDTPAIDGKHLMVSLMSGFFKSETFRNLVESIIVKVIKLLLSLDVKTVLEKIDAEHLNTILGFFTSRRMEERALVQVETFIRRQKQSGTNLKSMLPEELLGLIGEVLDSLYPSMLEALLQWLKSPDVRTQLETRGRILLRDMMEKLTALQRFFISAGQYDRVLDEKMPELVGDLIRAVEEEGENPETRKKLIRTLVSGLSKFREIPLGELGMFRDEQKLIDESKRLVSRLFRFLSREDTKTSIADWIVRMIDGMPATMVGDVVKNITGLEEEEMVSSIAGITVQWFHRRGDEISRKVYAFLADTFSSLEPRPLGVFLGIHPELKCDIDLFITGKAVSVLENRIPDILDSFDVEQLVRDKINGLDMENVEKLLLMVIQKHLKWINIFGAILGSIIGMVQVLVNRIL